MNRREFLQLTAGALALAVVGAEGTAQSNSRAAPGAYETIESYFTQILTGFLKNAAATSKGYTVCDFPEGTKLKSCCTPSGKTYVSVARMLPAMAAWVASGRARPMNIDGKLIESSDVLLSIYRTAFDPKHPHYWGAAPPDKPTQRSVEACLVAQALWRLGDDFIAKLSSQDRTNIQNWLASCTQVPERTNNHAWFTAINQATRLELSRKWKEFKGDEQWMLEDLKGLDALYKPNNDGWYSDSPDAPVYDYYNFYVFPNFTLYWSQIIGSRYPEWNEKFRSRVREFLTKTPYFFDSDGGYPLYGRSLIYRWALLSGLVTGYQEKLWPHSSGLLKRIVLRNLDWHWKLGAYDEKRGKLRETFTPGGSTRVRENYIDNGHPYWPMTAFFVLGLPKDDLFWTAPEDPLPVEKADFVTRFEGPKMMLVGTKRTGEVKWVLAHPASRREYYRDKYMKFVYSSHFPFNVGDANDPIPIDQMLVFSEGKNQAARTSVDQGDLLPDGVHSTYRIKLGEITFTVTTRIRLIGEFQQHTHEIEADQELNGRTIRVSEGSYVGPPVVGATNGAWKITGFSEAQSGDVLGGENLISRGQMGTRLTATLTERRTTLASLHYASRKPPNDLDAQVRRIIGAWERQ